MSTNVGCDRRTFLHATGAAGVAATLSGVGTAGDAEGGREELIVGVSRGVPMDDVVRRLPAGASVVRREEDLGIVVVRLPRTAGAYDRIRTESRIVSLPGVKYTERNVSTDAPTGAERRSRGSVDGRVASARRDDEVPDTPLLPHQQSLHQSRVPPAWGVTRGDGEVTVAVVDTGIDYEHPDLEAQFGETRGKDFLDEDDDPAPGGDSHGTNVAGIVAADQSVGKVAGICDARLLACRVRSEDGGGQVDDVASAIRWATDEGADVIALPLSLDEYSRGLEEAVSYAFENGALPVAGAGGDEVGAPGSIDRVLAVGGLDGSGGAAWFSPEDGAVDLVAPATPEVVVTTHTDHDEEFMGQYTRFGGPGAAAATVAGVAALAKAADPGLGPGELRRRLKDTAVNQGLSPERQGSGRVDAARLLDPGETQSDTTPGATFSPRDPSVGERVRFSALSTVTEGGYVDQWHWTFGDEATATGEVAYHAFGSAGQHTVVLTLVDDDGRETREELTVEVGETACMVADETTFSGRGGGGIAHRYSFSTEQPCRLSITASGLDDDEFVVAQPPGRPAGEWDYAQRIRGEAGMVFTDADLAALDTSTDLEIRTRDAEGHYSFTVQELGAPVVESGDDEELAYPTAAVAASEGMVPVGGTIDFDATASKPPDEDEVDVDDPELVEYRWRMGDGTVARGEEVSHVYESPGEYHVTLTVVDYRGLTDSATTTVTATGTNGDGACGDTTVVDGFEGSLDISEKETFEYGTRTEEPCRTTVSLSGPGDADIDLYLTLDGREPTPNDYDRRAYGPGSEQEIVVEAGNLDADTTLGLMIEAYSGAGPYTLSVEEVGDADLDGGPTAAIDLGDAAPAPEQTVFFDGSGSTAGEDGEIQRYGWRFSDDTTAAGDHVERAFEEEGRYVAELTVTDGEGRSDTTAVTVEVAEDDEDVTCGSTADSEELDGRLDSPRDRQTFEYTAGTEDPCQVSVSLSGPGDADFDLYLTVDGSDPKRWHYDERSVNTGSEERIIVEDVHEGQEFGVLVDGMSGYGDFTLTVEEYRTESK